MSYVNRSRTDLISRRIPHDNSRHNLPQLRTILYSRVTILPSALLEALHRRCITTRTSVVINHHVIAVSAPKATYKKRENQSDSFANMRTPSAALLAMLATSHAFIAPSLTPNKLSMSPLQQNGVTRSSLFMSTTEKSTIGTPGTANLPWSELGFEFRPTKSHLRMVYKDGKWGEEELVEVRN